MCVSVCVCESVSDVCIRQKILKNFLSSRIDISEKCVCVCVCVCLCVCVRAHKHLREESVCVYTFTALSF